MKITDARLDYVVACKLHPLSEKIDTNIKGGSYAPYKPARATRVSAVLVGIV